LSPSHESARLTTDPAPEPPDRPSDTRPTVTGPTGIRPTATGPTDTGRAHDTTANDAADSGGTSGGSAPDDTTANDSAADRHRATPARPPVRRRSTGRRLLLAGLGVTLTVTALGAALLGYAGFEDAPAPSGADTGTAVRPRSVSLPAGWRPWRTPLRADSGLPAGYIPVNYNESGCRTDGTALFCAGTGFVVAEVDAARGTMGWRYGTLPQTARPIGVRDGLVYVYTEPDSSRRNLVALDTATGKQRWTRPISGSETAFLYDGGILTLTPDHSEVVAYNTAGDELWRTPEPAGDNCVPTVLGEDPYAVCWTGDDFLDTRPFTLVRLDPEDGTPRELAPMPKKALALGAVDGRPLYLAAETTEEVYQAGYERPYDAFLRVDPVTGKVTRIPLKRALRGAATLVGGVVYFVRTNGSVTAVSAASGKLLWERATDMENLSVPVVSAARGEIYFANRFGRLLALDSDTGSELWRTDALDDPGDTATETPPRVLLVDDAIVATAGTMVFSVNPDEPMSGPTASTGSGD
ncbi:outer membrane protein assembly factor BamB family protein, partial [Streptomyces brasiliscabiei]|uniref:outer membrane protein assembly factor BamB family protein n=1 Tax=Streptomyces brasiliscabiei TaxID=2736302 RepID=UPI001C0FD2CC